LSDLEKICRIEDQSFSHDPYPSFLIERLLTDQESLFLVVTDRAEEIVGYLVSKIEGDFAHLISLAVSPTQRRSGAATMLLEELIASLQQRKIHEVELEVRLDNKGAIKLYSQFGFSDQRIISRYYSDGSTALLMRKEIQ